MIERNYITPELLESIDKINRDCISLHLPPPPAVFIECKVEPIDGGDPILIHKEKANSFVRNYYNVLFHIAGFGVVPSDTTFGEGHLNRKRTTSAINAFTTANAANMSEATTTAGASGNTMFGIVVGTDDTAESLDSYNIGALVAEGSGAGQMNYAAGSIATATYNSGTKKWSSVNSRVMNNNSSGSISVKETGLLVNINVAGTAASTLVERNVLSSPVTVPAAYKLTVTYTFEMTFPG